ncbi:hypothetical protein HanXRQr2_Chr13g0592831 [Helianthus annuus]|uniref:Uncharacterized protein n=1 Tax=Helianthus annuus TaxID=4232 RepID=A0A9K3EKX6_HELAN|nr:hypothetical protein HanXRQr2_Chr13g0592831 [Helianthus annuus]
MIRSVAVPFLAGSVCFNKGVPKPTGSISSKPVPPGLTFGFGSGTNLYIILIN